MDYLLFFHCDSETMALSLFIILIVLNHVEISHAPYNETKIYQTAEHVQYEIEYAPECVNSAGAEAEKCIKDKSGLSHDHLIEHDDFETQCCYKWVEMDCHEFIAKVSHIFDYL